MATLTNQPSSFTGLNLSTTSADVAGDEFTNTGRELLYVSNGGGSSITVTVTAQQTNVQKQGFGSLTVSDTTVTIPAGEDRFIGPFPVQRFSDSAGRVQVSYSDVTSVVVGVIDARKAD